MHLTPDLSEDCARSLARGLLKQVSEIVERLDHLRFEARVLERLLRKVACEPERDWFREPCEGSPAPPAKA